MKEEDYVDTDIWIGSTVERSYGCRQYVKSVPLKYKNDVVVGHFVLSELMVEALTSAAENEDIEELERASRDLFLGAVTSAISELKKRGFLRVAKLQDAKIDCHLIKDLQSLERRLTYDDALHLSVAISQGCKRFVTTDNLFDTSHKEGSRKLITYLRKEHGLRTKHVKK